MSAASFRDLGCYHGTPASLSKGERGKRAGILQRIYAAITQVPEGEAQRQMTRLLRQSGGRLTDDIERRLAELTRNGNLWH